MSTALISDAHEYPHLFDFRLPASRSEIAAIEHLLGAKLPPTFCEVLETLGQGAFFDGESLLGVHEADDGTGDIEQVNRELRDKQGLPPSLVVFHLGTGGLHAFDTETVGPE